MTTSLLENLEYRPERRRESEQKFHALADHMAQLAWIADASGYIVWYNTRWYDYTGTTLEEMRGWGWQKIHHPDYVEPVTEKFRAHVALGVPWEDTFPLRGADGKYRWFRSRAFPTRDDSGKVNFWCGTNTDITEQRQAEEALRASEATVRERERRVRTLYELTARTDIGFSEKINHLLRAGREWLGLSMGILARIDCDTGIYEIAEVDAASAEGPQVGFTYILRETFCSEIVRRGSDGTPLAVENAGADAEWREHPAYKAYGSEAYLAAVVRVNADIWGTLAFVSSTPRSEPFTEFDKDIVRLIAQWAGGQIAHLEAEEALRTTALQQRRFVREMLASVTEGKLCLCDDPRDLPAALPPVSDPILLTPDTMRHFRKRVEAVAGELQLPKERMQDLLTAVGEAGMNAIKHGGGGTGRIHADRERRVMQVVISDQGKGIRQEDLHRATLEKGWSGAGSLGHGFFLMLRTVDRTYLLTGAQGTTIVLEQESIAPEPAWAQAVSA